MAAESEIKVNLVPQVSGLEELIGQLRRTGESLVGLADSLQRLSDGSPDAARTAPDSEGGNPFPGFNFGQRRMPCPAAVDKLDHDGHEWTAHVPDSPGHMATDYVRECPGHPLRPWHSDSRTP